jgi:hypothetical protein
VLIRIIHVFGVVSRTFDRTCGNMLRPPGYKHAAIPLCLAAIGYIAIGYMRRGRECGTLPAGGECFRLEVLDGARHLFFQALEPDLYLTVNS